MPNKIKTVRITTSSRIPDRFLTCQVKEEPEDKKNYGKIFALVEILNPWFPTSQIGQMIINTLTRNYYKAESTSDLENFESALLKVNEALASITQSGETDWIGNLNAVLAVMVGSDLHLSQTGKADAYLVREGKLNHITYGLTSDSEPHPLKTFSNITSGSLKTNDQIIFSSQKLSEHLSLDEVNSIVSRSFEPYKAALQISKILKRAKEKSVNAILIKIEGENITSSEDLPDTIYLDQPLESPATLIKKINSQYLLPFGREFSAQSSKLLGDFAFFIKKTLWPRSKITAKYVSYYFKLSTLKITKKVAPKVSKLWTVEEIEPSFDKEKEKRQFSPAEIEDLPKPPGLAYKIKHYEEKPKRASQFLNSILEKLQTFWQFILKNRKKPSFYIILATVLVLILILTINFSKNKRTESVQLQNVKQVLAEAKSKFEDGKLSLAYNEKDRALSLLSEAKEKAETIKDNPLVKDETKNLISQINQELDKVTGSVRIIAQNSIISFENGKKIFEFEKGLYTISPNNNSIFRASLIDGRVGNIAVLKTENGLYKDAVLFPQNKGLLIYTFLKKMYLFKFLDNSLSEITASGNFENAEAVTVFGSNIYLLDGKSGVIYKHSPSGGKYLAGSPYSAADVDLTGGVSFAIDGSVFVLHSDGSVTKLSKGRKVDFQLSEIPQPDSKIDKPTKIYTDENLKSIYILDSGKNRILEFDKKGQYVRQYVFEGLSSEISDFDLNLIEKKLWVLSQNKVFEGELLP